MKDVVIFGAGSVGRLSKQIIDDINKNKKMFNVIGYLDDNEKIHDTSLNGVLILGGLEWMINNPHIYIVLGFSNPNQKLSLIKRLKDINCTHFAQLIHPTAWISERVYIGEGSIIYPGVHIDVDVRIGDFTLFNKLCTIGHDSIIGDFSTFSPGVKLGGNNIIGDNVEFGINSCSIQNLKIGASSVIGAGSVIIRDIPDNVIVVGNPGRVLK